MKFGPLVVAAFALLSDVRPASSWMNIGPSGGEARSLAADPAGNNVFVLNRRTGIFRRSSGGAWTLVFDAMARGVTPTRVTVDSVSSRVYIGTTTGLFCSDDNGATWRFLIQDPIIDVTAAANRVIVATPMGLRRGGNAGVTWISISSPVSSVQAPVSLVRFDPRAVDRVLAVNAGNLFRSEDAGDSWMQLTPKNIVAVAFGESIYAGGSDGVYVCDTSCTQLSADPAIDVANFQAILHEALSDGVMKYSVARWERLVQGFPPAVAVSLLATPAELFVGTTAGVYGTTDDTSWMNRSDGLTNVRIASITAAGGDLYAATRGQSIMRRRGETWTTADAGLPYHPPALPIARVLATDGATVYAGFPGDGLFRSTDQGGSWSDISAGLPSRDLVDVAADSGIVIAATGTGLAKSTDRGTTWQMFPTSTAIIASAIAFKGQVIVAGRANAVLVSTNGGSTWESADLTSTIVRVAVAGGRAYAATDVDVFVKGSSGWSRAPIPAAPIGAMIGAGSRLYVALTGTSNSTSDQPSGIYLTDDGVNWSLFPGSNDLPTDITSLAVDAATLYAGTNGGGIFATSLLPLRQRAVRR